MREGKRSAPENESSGAGKRIAPGWGELPKWGEYRMQGRVWSNGVCGKKKKRGGGETGDKGM